MILRLTDVVLSSVLLVMLTPILIILFIIGYFDTGNPIFTQTRIGVGKRPFTLFKFRSMPNFTCEVPTHLVSIKNISSWGRFIRKYKLDELPQLLNVLFGNMSMVGPRPCLKLQHDVIIARDKLGVFDFRPGITGLAQLASVDMSMPDELASLDYHMMSTMSFRKYMHILFCTLIGRGFRNSIKN